MSEILLTRKSLEIEGLLEAHLTMATTECFGGILAMTREDMEDTLDKACRAQLRKVVEWVEKNNTANYVEKYQGWPMQLDEEHWVALKAAGGEG